MELLLVDLCYTAIDRFVRAHRTTNYGAGISRRFRGDSLWKKAKEYIRATSPDGEVDNAIERVDNLPEPKKAGVIDKVMHRARARATELNETAPEPIGELPTQNYAKYVLDVVDNQGPSGIQFALYKPPVSSPPPTSIDNGMKSSPGAVGPVRRKRQRKSNRPGRESRHSVDPLGSCGRTIERPGSFEADTPTLEDQNLNFSSSLYTVHGHSSSASRQRILDLVPDNGPSQPSGSRISNLAQGNQNTLFSSSWENPTSTSFYTPLQPAAALEAPVLDRQQHMPGNINAVGFGHALAGAGLFDESGQSLYGGAARDSRCSSVYHTPASAIAGNLELSEDTSPSQFPPYLHPTEATPDPFGLGSALNHGGAVGPQADLDPLFEGPLAYFGTQEVNGHWDSALTTGYQNAPVAVAADDGFIRPSPQGFQTFANPGPSHIPIQPTQRGFPLSSSEGYFSDRRVSAQWQDERGRQHRRLLDTDLNHHLQQTGHDAERHRAIGQRSAPYQQHEPALLCGDYSMLSGNNNGASTTLGVEDQLPNEVLYYDAQNSTSNTAPSIGNTTLQSSYAGSTLHLAQTFNYSRQQDLGPLLGTSSATTPPSQHELPTTGLNALSNEPGGLDQHRGTLILGRTQGQYSQRTNESLLQPNPFTPNFTGGSFPQGVGASIHENTSSSAPSGSGHGYAPRDMDVEDYWPSFDHLYNYDRADSE